MLFSLSSNVLHCSSCSSFSMMFDMFLLENFMFFVFFLVLILFRFKSLFWFYSGFLVFGSINGWTGVFGSTRTSQNQVKYLRLCLVCHCFDNMNFSWRACLANTSSNLFWQFCFKKNMVLSNMALKKTILVKIKKKIAYCILLNPYNKLHFLKKKRKKSFF